MQRLCDPFRSVVWYRDLDEPLSKDEVMASRPIAPKAEWGAWPPPSLRREVHAGRVRWFMLNGWSDPISVDVGIPSMCHVAWPVVDGNHRLAAAIMLGHEKIRTEFSGCVDVIDSFVFKDVM